MRASSAGSRYIRDAMRDPEPASREYLASCGGLFRDMTIHNFDNVRWLMGDAVEEVFAMGSALVDPMFVELNDVDTSVVYVCASRTAAWPASRTAAAPASATMSAPRFSAPRVP